MTTWEIIVVVVAILVFFALVMALVFLIKWIGYKNKAIKQQEQKDLPENQQDNTNISNINNSINQIVKDLATLSTHNQNILSSQESSLEKQDNFKITLKDFENKIKNKIENLNKSSEDAVGTLTKISNLFLSNQKVGATGEILLEKMLENVLGKGGSIEKNNLWERQYALKSADSTNLNPDVMVHINNELIPIDSKFPNEVFLNYKDRKTSANDFAVAVKKKINDITKYIAPKYKTSYAIMYLPSEAIWIEIFNNFYQKIVEYSQQQKVIICGPSTLLITLLGWRKNEEARKFWINKEDEIKNIKEWHDCIKSLTKEIDDFKKFINTSIPNKWSKLEKQIKKSNKIADKSLIA